MQRLRRYEFDAARKYEELQDVDSDEMDAVTKAIATQKALSQWLTIVEQMRKTEADLLKVLEDQGKVVQKDAIREFLVVVIETAKSLLLKIPPKVAPGFEGMEWQEIQHILGEEIREALEALSKNPLGVQV